MGVYDHTTSDEIRKEFVSELPKRFELLGMLVYLGENYLNRETDKQEIKSLIYEISECNLFSMRFPNIMGRVDRLVYKSGKWDTLGDIPYLIKHYINLYKNETGSDLSSL